MNTIKTESLGSQGSFKQHLHLFPPLLSFTTRKLQPSPCDPTLISDKMGLLHVFYTIVFFLFIISTVLYLTRDRWLHLLPYDLPFSQYLYTPIPSTFASDAEAGLHSSNFDLASNITDGDSRTGLNQAGKREVQRIMKRNRVGFDEARRIYMEQGFKKNNIGADGLPRDPKFVSFS